MSRILTGGPENSRQTISRRSDVQVLVRDNNVDRAMKVLKKKLQREGVIRELKRRRYYEKPSERKTREAQEAVRRARKEARKQAEREGLIAPRKRPERMMQRPAPRPTVQTS